MSASPSPAPDEGPLAHADAAPPPEALEAQAPPAPFVERERKRVRLACSNCHRGKIKCDGERPCDRCIKRGVPGGECVDFQRKRTACVSCRAVKMKCDGNRPCKRCVKKGKGDDCTDIEAPGMRRPRPDHRLKHAEPDGALDDAHRPVPYNYEDAAAAAAGYYYAPPWAYPVPGGPWQPYGPAPPHVYPPHPAVYGAPSGEDARGEYTPALRSSYPGELPPGMAPPMDPALDPALQSANGHGAPVGEGWREIIAASQAGRGTGYYEGERPEGAEGDGEHEGDGEGDGDEDAQDDDDAKKEDADEE